MGAERQTITGTTESDGTLTAYSDVINGRISSIQYVKTDFDDGSTMTFTGDETGLEVMAETGINASTTRAPRQATHDILGAASLYAAGGLAVEDHIVLANERLKLVVAAGGNAKAGTWHITIE